MTFETPIRPDTNTRAGRMMAAGRVKITLRSKASGEHLTISFEAARKDAGKWNRHPLEQATHVFIKESPAPFGQGKIGTFYPATGKTFLVTENKTFIWAMAAAIHFINQGQTNPQADIAEENECGKCSRELTDPVSIERGIGPECFAKITGSKRTKQAA